MKKIILTLSILFACIIGLLLFQPITPVHSQSEELISRQIYRRLEEELNKLPEDAGYLIEVRGKTIFEKNRESRLPSYSVIKLWIAATAFGLGKDTDENMTLIQAMLENSDNDATNKLIDALGGREEVNRYINRLGYGNTFLGRYMLETPAPGRDNYASAQDAVTFMQDLVNNKIIGSGKIMEILQNRTLTGTDPFKPNSVLPASAQFIGKSGILNEGRNDVGSFLDDKNNRVFFAVFIPSGGANSEAIISNLEQLMYNPSTNPTATTTSTSTATSSQASATRLTGPVKGSRLCIKIGNPDPKTNPKPNICNIRQFTLSGSSAGTPPTVEAGQLVSEIKKEFGVDMQGAWNEQALRWTYNAFYKWKQTNPLFMNLINGQPLILTYSVKDSNAYGNTVKLGQDVSDENQFLGYLVHEYGHVIYHTKEGSNSYRIKGDELFANPGPITSYGQTDITENYPEMLSYCLTKRPVKPLISEQRWNEGYRELAEKIVGLCL